MDIDDGIGASCPESTMDEEVSILLLSRAKTLTWQLRICSLGVFSDASGVYHQFEVDS
jgi:hypothetical protein